jgi:hypothetical protein
LERGRRCRFAAIFGHNYVQLFPNCTACSSVVKRMKPRLAGLPLPDTPQPPNGSVEGEKVVARFA